MLRRFLAKLTSDSKQGKGNTPQWVAKNQHVTNNMNEIQLLNGHTDIIRALVRIDSSSFASASDDCTIIIWNVDTGEAHMRLVGHTSTITCMLLVSRNTLISGSADRSLIIWDLTTGTASKVIPDCHQGSVKCLLRLDSVSFMSAGNDKHLNIWKTSGELVDLIERNEQENLNCVLMISNNRVVTAGNSAEMVVYSLIEKRCISLLVAHREPVRCLINLNANMFVSASIDGQIVVWSTTTLMALHEFNFHKTYINSDHVYIYNVHQLVKLSEQYLAACIGSGYTIYKIGDKNAEIVMECLNAHSATVLAIAPLYYGTALVTSSADTTIRFWGSKLEFQFRTPPVPKPTSTADSKSPSSSSSKSIFSSGSSRSSKSSKSDSAAVGSDGPRGAHSDPRYDIKYVPMEKSVERSSVSSFLTATLLDSDKPSVGVYPPRLIGDVCCHSDQVNIILPLSPFSFASASGDGSIVIWRDGRVQSAFRGELSVASLRQWHTKQIEMSILEATTSHYTSSEAKYSLSGSASSLDEFAPRNPTRDFLAFDPKSLSNSQNSLPSNPASILPPNANGSTNTSPTSTTTPSMPSLDTNTAWNTNSQSAVSSPRSLTNDRPGSGKITPLASNTTLPPRVSVRVPPYIADNAYYLFYELNFSLEQVQEALLAEGNSEAIVVAALAELQQ
jgi:WD40 repeat protein